MAPENDYSMKEIVTVVCFFCVLGLFGQDFEQDSHQSQGGKIQFKSGRPKAKKKDSITFTALDYKIISLARDTTSIDTTLSVRAYYKHNPIGKDMFEYLPFSNMGQTYNSLAYDFRQTEIQPQIGGTTNRFYYLSAADIPYYYLPTPITQFTYKSAVEQGQMLHSLFSANINPRLNIFIRYNAMRSLGNYQNILSSIGNFVGGFSYTSKNKKYWILAHYSSQDIEHQENGGLLVPTQFSSGDLQFTNRGLVDVVMTDANNFWEAKRYFLHHQYNFLRNENAINAQILLKHQAQYETTYYNYNQAATAPNNFFGESYVPTNIFDKSNLKTWSNQLGAELVLPYLGKTYIYGKSYFYNYFFNSVFSDASGVRMPNRISDTDYGIGISWKKLYKGFLIEASGEQMLAGTLLGTNISAKAAYKFNEKNQISAGINLHSAMPNFNFLLYQSDYKNYNWYNASNFGRQNNQTLYADIKTQWADISFDLSNINNYTYFDTNSQGQATASQHAGNIQYLKLKLSKDLRFGKFGLDNTLMYQQVIQGNEILNVPTFTTRNTLYFSSYVFKKAMYLQTGVTLKYFTSYHMNHYNPLLAEFQTQTSQKLGNFPIMDAFINAKVRTMRIFFKVEHFHSRLLKRNYYSAPNYPYRDYILRLGISWNFFT